MRLLILCSVAFFCTESLGGGLPYIQVTKEPVPDIIPYSSIPSAVEFLNKYNLSDVGAYFYREYSEALEELVIYSRPVAIFRDDSKQCLKKLHSAKRDDYKLLKVCARMAAVERSENLDMADIAPQEFGYMPFTMEAEVKKDSHGGHTYVTDEKQENYLIYNDAGGDFQSGELVTLSGLLSYHGDFSFRESSIPFSRKFVVKKVDRQTEGAD